MSTIHTAMTGKSDSLIDAVRESEERKDAMFKLLRQSNERLLQQHPEWFEFEVRQEDHIVAPPIWCAVDHNNIHHPDYMRMVVHQMD